MGSWIFTWLQAWGATLLLIIVSVYAAGLKWESYDLKTNLQYARQELTVCSTENAKLKIQKGGFIDALNEAEQQCKELLKYERNKPKKIESDDSDVDDHYLDSLFRRLRSDATGKDSSGPASPRKDHASGKDSRK